MLIRRATYGFASTALMAKAKFHSCSETVFATSPYIRRGVKIRRSSFLGELNLKFVACVPGFKAFYTYLF